MALQDFNYLSTNREAWNVRTEQHLNSNFYDVKGWLGGKSSLQPIEQQLLGNLEGQRVLHLMCHFGLDTLSMARLGAEVTGLDFSPKAITAARELAKQAALAATFVEGDLYAAPQLIEGRFDTVFLSYGTIGWLSDIAKWAEVVAHFLRPGGRLVFVEFHPALWMLDDKFKEIKHRYFAGSPIIEKEGTYTDVGEVKLQTMITWNHGLAEVMSALLTHQLSLKHFAEYDFSPYAIFGERGLEISPGEHVIRGYERMLPLVYSLVMTAP